MAFPNSFTTDTPTSGDCKTKWLQILANPWGCGLSHQGNSGGYAMISAVVQIYIFLMSRNVEHLFTCSLTIWGVPVQLFGLFFFFTGIYLFLIRHNSPFWFFSKDLKSLEAFFFKSTEVIQKFPTPLLFLPNQRNLGVREVWDLFLLFSPMFQSGRSHLKSVEGKERDHGQGSKTGQFWIMTTN